MERGRPAPSGNNADADSDAVRRNLDELAQAMGSAPPQASWSPLLALNATTSSRPSLLRLRGSLSLSATPDVAAGQYQATAAAARSELLQQLQLAQAYSPAARELQMAGTADLNAANLRAQDQLVQQETSLRNTRLLLLQQELELQDNSAGGQAAATPSLRVRVDMEDAGRRDPADATDVLAGSAHPPAPQLGGGEDAGLQRSAALNDDDDDDDDNEDDLDDDEYYANFDTDDSHTLYNETFPFRLYRMLYEVEKSSQQDIVSFCDHGRVVCIHKSKRFVSEIMPKYFTTSRLASLQRQFNLYGFQRINEGSLSGGYHHVCFQKNKRGLCRKMKRQKRRNRKQDNLQ